MTQISRGRFTAMMLAGMIGGLASLPGISQAQAYPNKPLRMIVPYPPGGAVDVLGRLLGQKLSVALGQPVVIENLPGASGIIGTTAAAKAAPDGYTILMGYVSTLAIHPSMYAKLTYDPLKDFVAISKVADTSLVMVVPPGLGVNNLKEFVALAKSKPGQLSYASVGNGSGAHLSAELLKLMAGINIVQVPYKGSGPALTDLVGQHVHVMFDALPSSLPLVNAGKLKALAVTGSARTSAAPKIPTVAESGYPGYDISPWFGVLAPAGTPPDIVNRLNRELTKIVAQPDVKTKYAGLGAEPVSSSPDQFAAFMRVENLKWEKLVKTANIKAD